jgi:hypothetical protein
MNMCGPAFYTFNKIDVPEFYSTKLAFLFNNFIILEKHVHSRILHHSSNMNVPELYSTQLILYSIISQ